MHGEEDGRHSTVTTIEAFDSLMVGMSFPAGQQLQSRASQVQISTSSGGQRRWRMMNTSSPPKRMLQGSK
uniref:Uncharacterized protein n=1 Tax=Arundo donax TaxID=35708 RepID=A0A0A9H0R4_ARUDO